MLDIAITIDEFGWRNSFWNGEAKHIFGLFRLGAFYPLSIRDAGWRHFWHEVWLWSNSLKLRKARILCQKRARIFFLSCNMVEWKHYHHRSRSSSSLDPFGYSIGNWQTAEQPNNALNMMHIFAIKTQTKRRWIFLDPSWESRKRMFHFWKKLILESFEGAYYEIKQMWSIWAGVWIPLSTPSI